MGGYDKNKAREDALNALGRQLARRAGSKCELFEEGGTRLTPFEVPPVPSDPDLERTLLLSEEAIEGITSSKPIANTDRWRVLETAMWSENAAVKVVAVRMLRRLVDQGVDWARDALDMVYLTEDEQEWVDADS